jgi:hypothetical protein
MSDGMPVIEPDHSALWPKMTDEMRANLHADMAEAIAILTVSADRLTRYPGGGAPAHAARQAASRAAGIKAWLNNDPDWLNVCAR